MSVKLETLKRLVEKPFTTPYPFVKPPLPAGLRGKPEIVVNEKPDPARLACPAHLDIRGYVRKIVEGDYEGSLELIRQKVCLPASLGRTCNHPCEEMCKRNYGEEEPVADAWLKRFVADWVYQKKRERGEPLLKKPVRTKNQDPQKKVAVVGAGPSGLQVAYDLAYLGYPVTAFEALPEPGGMLRYGVPRYKLPLEVLRPEIEAIAALGVEFRTGVRIGRDISLADLRGMGYKAIFIGIGSHISRKLRVQGEELQGVWGGIEFLRALNMGEKIDLGKKAIVVGGGNVAIDVARCAIRLGAEVQLVCLESREEMPAHAWEITEACEEGMTILHRRAPRKILGKNGRVTGVELIGVKSVFDSEGRFNPVLDESTHEVIPCDSVLIAIGQMADLSVLGEERSQFGLTRSDTLIAVDPDSGATSVAGVFAEGEVIRGPSTIIESLAGGRRASLAIDRYLSGNSEGNPFVDEYDYARDLKALDITAERRYMFLREEAGQKKRVPMPMLAPEERKTNYKEVYLGYTEEMARNEARRCLSCYKCVGCELCLKYCPANAIELKLDPQKGDIYWNDTAWKATGPPEIRLLQCVMCQMCEEVCRCGIYHLTSEYELCFTGPLDPEQIRVQAKSGQ